MAGSGAFSEDLYIDPNVACNYCPGRRPRETTLGHEALQEGTVISVVEEVITFVVRVGEAVPVDVSSVLPDYLPWLTQAIAIGVIEVAFAYVGRVFVDYFLRLGACNC